MKFLESIFASERFMPHAFCYLWNPRLIWLHAISDMLIALAYFSIPITLVYFIRKRRDLPFDWMFICFGTFILACGATHAMEVWTLWHPVYWLSGAVKVVTAMASVPTAILLIRLVPRALALPRPEELRLEVTQRRLAQEELRIVNEKLEQRVEERTAELRRANKALIEEGAQRKRAEHSLDVSRAELAHASRAMTLGELLASISHEINQPLTAVVTDAHACQYMLAKSSPDLNEVRDAVADIAQNGTRAGEVIARVRTLLRKAAPEQSTLDINQLIRDVMTLANRELEEHEVSVELHLSAQLPVAGDRVQLQQVILNLVMNAVEAMETAPDGVRLLQIRSEDRDPDSVVIQVQDSGVGFDAATATRMFDTFFTNKPGGMGMGLAISRSIIEAHRGRLWAAPNTNHGATFQFTLPTVSAPVWRGDA